MERLTKRDIEGFPILAKNIGYATLLGRLAAYEDAEERGDIVRVVRCRDCKYHDPEDMKCDCRGLARIGCNFALDDNYFCAYGELREEAEAALAKEG